jgi:hypothetical protein
MGRIGGVPDLVRGIAEWAQQINCVRVAFRQGFAVAHAHHLRAAAFVETRFTGDMREIFRMMGVGHIEDGGTVGLLYTGQRVQSLGTASVPPWWPI